MAIFGHSKGPSRTSALLSKADAHMDSTGWRARDVSLAPENGHYELVLRMTASDPEATFSPIDPSAR